MASRASTELTVRTARTGRKGHKVHRELTEPLVWMALTQSTAPSDRLAELVTLGPRGLRALLAHKVPRAPPETTLPTVPTQLKGPPECEAQSVHKETKARLVWTVWMGRMAPADRKVKPVTPGPLARMASMAHRAVMVSMGPTVHEDRKDHKAQSGHKAVSVTKGTPDCSATPVLMVPTERPDRRALKALSACKASPDRRVPLGSMAPTD